MGVGNLIVLATFCCSAVIFSMSGLASASSVIVIAVLYGFFAGICEWNFLLVERSFFSAAADSVDGRSCGSACPNVCDADG